MEAQETPRHASLDAGAAATHFYTEVLSLRKLRITPVEKPRTREGSVPHLRPDFCFTTRLPISEVVRQFRRCGFEILQGPIPDPAAPAVSVAVYLKDPYRNVVEVRSEAGV